MVGSTLVTIVIASGALVALVGLAQVALLVNSHTNTSPFESDELEKVALLPDETPLTFQTNCGAEPPLVAFAVKDAVEPEQIVV